MNNRERATRDTNVFKALAGVSPEEHHLKAQLVIKIDGIMRDRQLKQIEAAELLGVKQPDVSKMLRGEFRQFSVERLLRFLVALGHDVDIIVRPHRDHANPASVQVS